MDSSIKMGGCSHGVFHSSGGNVNLWHVLAMISGVLIGFAFGVVVGAINYAGMC